MASTACLPSAAHSRQLDQRGPRTGDAFGHMIREAHATQGRRGRVFELVERADGTIDVGDASRYFDPIDLWPPHEAIAVGWACGRVIDIGVGAGRHALELARRGHDVVGIDSSEGAVEVSSSRGLRSYLAEVGRPSSSPPFPAASFDTALLLGNNLGLLGNPVTARCVLQQLGHLLTANGCIVASSMDPHLRPSPHDTDYMAQNQAQGRLPGQYRLRLRYDRVASAWFDYLFLSTEELSQLLERAGGWKIARVEARGPWYSVQLVRT